jgi:two-component system cell cycle sensor histidine kinase/response regulator CckA
MGESISILLVDDNPSMTMALADVLEAKGYTIHMASSGNEALEILRDHPIKILLTDVIMPEMNGLELYRATRKEYPNLITIFMTAYAADDLIQKGMAEGIKTVLTKPVDINLLLLLFSAHKRIILESGKINLG